MGALALLILTAFCLSWALTPLIRRAAFALGAVDMPGERKIHSEPIPRIGGVAIVLSFAVTLAIASGIARLSSSGFAPAWASWWPLLAGGAIVFLGGLLDDIRPLPAWGKFLVQSAGALTAMWLGLRIDHASLFGSDPIDLGIFALPLTFLWIVGITNAFNLVDGLDGLAAGLGSIAAGTCAALFLLRGDPHDAVILIIILGALLGFLPHNFNPARIYLGDSGSLLIGYILAVSAILGTQKTATTLAVFVPLLVLGIPIIDTLFSMLRRFKGFAGSPNHRHQADLESCTSWLRAVKRMFEADQRHFHHKLLAMGFSHRGAVLTLYTFAAGLSSFALLSVIAEYRNAGILLLTAVLATVIGISKLDYHEMHLVHVGGLLRWYEQLAVNRRFFLGFLDIVLITAAYWCAVVLKYSDSGFTDQVTAWYSHSFPTVLIVQFLCLYVFGLYRGVWRAMGVGDLVKIAMAVAAAAAMSFSFVVIRDSPPGTGSFFLIDLLLLGLFTGGIRSAYRFIDHWHQRSVRHGGTALIYGAGRGGQLVLRELMQNSTLGLRPIGFIDDDPSLVNRTIGGVPVLGRSPDVPAILDDKLVTSVLISSNTTEAERLRGVIQACQDRGVTVLVTNLEFRHLEQDHQSTTELEPAPL
ncbi:hypothetical protein [Petrachloros mirabilis]